MLISPDTSTSLEHAVGSSSGAFGASMIADDIYMFVSSTACWIAVGVAPTASAGVGSMFVPAGVVVVLIGTDSYDIAVIQDAAAGKASLTRCRTR